MLIFACYRKMAGQFVKGFGNAGVIPSGKHFIMNEFETNRMASTSSSGGGGGGGMGGGPGGNSSAMPSAVASSSSSSTSSATSSATSDSSTDSYSVAIDDKAFHETYLAPWYDVVKNGIGGAMCAMNRVNLTYSVRSLIPGLHLSC